MDSNNMKKMSMLVVGILAVFLMVSAVSALSLTVTQPDVLNDTNTQVTATVTSLTNFNLTSLSSGTIVLGPGVSVDYSASTPITDTNTVTFTFQTTDDSDFSLEDVLSVSAVDAANSSDEASEDIHVKYQSVLNEADLKLSRIGINTADGFGDDENYWYPLDNVEVNFDVENKGDWDVEDIEIKACLYDLNEEECILDEGDMDVSEDNFNLDHGDDQTVNLNIFVDPDQLTEGNTDYALYVSAIGRIDDREASDAIDGSDTGISGSEDIEIRTSDDFVIVDEEGMTFNPETAACGDTVEVVADVWNVGDRDLKDNHVFLRIRNDELGIYEDIQFPSGIDAMDYEEVRYTFEVPTSAKEKVYSLAFTVYDDEDMGSNDLYENDEGDEAIYSGFLTVDSCSLAQRLSVSASLDSEAVAGEPLNIKTTITNTGSSTDTYTLSASGYSTWANSFEVDTPSLALASGDAAQIMYTLDVKDDVEGTQEFTIEILPADGGEPISQRVQVNIAPKSGFSLSGNGYIWGLGLLNIILVLIIIVVAVRVARK